MGSPPISNPSLEIWKCLCFEFLWCCLGGYWKFLHHNKWSQYIFSSLVFQTLLRSCLRFFCLGGYTCNCSEEHLMKMQVHKKPFQKRFQCIVHLFRWRNGLKNVNTYYWLIWEEKNSWIDDACENFSLCKQIHLVLFRYFAVKLRLGGPEGKFAKMYFNLQKDDDLAFSENHLAVANVLKCSQLLVFT